MKIQNLFRLSEVCKEITVGYVGPMAKEYIDNGVPLLRSLNIKPFVLNLNDLKYISEDFHHKISKSRLDEGDVVIVRTGQPGTSCVIPSGFSILNCSDLVIARANKEVLNPYYLSFFFNSQAKKYVENELVGAIQQHFNIGSAKDMWLKLPSLQEQDRIVEIVNRINSKIELNSRINSELEAMAKLIYEYWFVQFDFPDANGKPYKSSGGKMVWNEQFKREIPERWQVKSWQELIASDKTGDWGKEEPEGNYQLKVQCIRGADINGINGKGEVKAPERYILEKNEHKILSNGDLVVEISGGSPTQSTG
ncbi:MAG TPA: restriction endonuclease subunit S, partial [Tenuifilaceae bacterium]|nr:restriction endonuclease subunit S [Tenuifilaceae bacterium]